MTIAYLELGEDEWLFLANAIEKAETRCQHFHSRRESEELI